MKRVLLYALVGSGATLGVLWIYQEVTWNLELRKMGKHAIAHGIVGDDLPPAPRHQPNPAPMWRN